MESGFVKTDRKVSMILTISNQEFQAMRMAAMDDDKDEALRMIKIFIRRLEQQKRHGMKSHLDG